jgi:hypothetical protein
MGRVVEMTVKQWLEHYERIAEVIWQSGKREAARQYRLMAFKRALLSGIDREAYKTES